MTLPVHVIDPAALADARAGTMLALEGEEGRHAVAVRRLRVGEHLDIVDGLGRRARATVATVGTASLTAQVEQVALEPESPVRVIVAQALAKGDRADTAVETLTEVGVDEVWAWQAARCVARWDASSRGIDRWNRVAREAGKQSRRARFPVVSGPVSTAEVAARAARCTLALVLDEQASQPLASTTIPPAGDVLLVVGPEGGITPEERAAYEEAGAVVVRLGDTVLRTSTAGTVAAAVVLANSGRWTSGR